MPGIDLTTPEPPPKPKSSEPAQGSAKPGSPGSNDAKSRDDAAPMAPGESDVALEDRVKAVQRKGFLKRHRFEVGAQLPGSINDAFYEKIGGTLKLAYNFEDSFALAVRGTHYVQLRSAHVREGKQAFLSQLLVSQLSNTLMFDGIWSPIYGKISWLGSKIVHFDVYLLAGFGAAWSATSYAPRDEGPHLATEFGGGIRFYPLDWLALDGGVGAMFYPDQPNASVPSTMQKVITAQVGISFFFPFTFEYVYP
jgi:outer membrane beta-barrel protein